MKALNFQFAGIIVIAVLFAGCNKEEPIPSYIHIDKFTLTTSYADQGSSSNKIVDAWIYVDDQLAGAYELPCTVPVLYQGTHTVKVVPGVKENGIADTRIPYIFYDRYEESVTLVAGEITTINPTTQYAQSADFSWLEDFEGSAHGICKSTGIPDTIMQITTAPAENVFELSGSGGVVLGAGQTSYFGLTCNKFSLPHGDPVFLELDYKCNTDFSVGYIGYNGTILDVQGISLTLRPTTGWNKVYINLTKEISSATNSTDFAIYFAMQKNVGLPNSYFYLDNVKLIN